LGMAYGASLTELTFAGLVGMEDPPREGVAEAVLQLRRGGVKVIMVTGDSKETALAIARRCGILGPDHHLHHPHASHTFFDNASLLPLGHDNDRMDDMDTDNDSSDDVVLTSMLDQPTSHNPLDDLEFGAGLALSGEQLDSIPAHVLSESIMGVRVFYRVAPRHKLSLVRAFQQHDDIVAMTGDGVNDATALKAADIGVAMGKGGTDVAKEAADMILTDDDFSTITKAVAEGKGIFFNIRNFLAFQLSTSFAALLMQTIATAFGLPSPMNAMQVRTQAIFDTHMPL
jgi:Ca2+-transporting ATPase